MAEHCGEHTTIIVDVMYPYFDKHARWLMSFTCKFMQAMYLADTPNAYPSERSVLHAMVTANNSAGIEWVAAFRGALPNNAPKSTDRGWWGKKQYEHFSRWVTYGLHKVPNVSMDTLVYLTNHGMPRAWIHSWLVRDYDTVAERRVVAKRFGVAINNRTKETHKTLRAHATKGGLASIPTTDARAYVFDTKEQNILRGLMKSHRINDACVFCEYYHIQGGANVYMNIGMQLYRHMLKYGIPLDSDAPNTQPLMLFVDRYIQEGYGQCTKTPFSVLKKALRYDFNIPVLKDSWRCRIRPSSPSSLNDKMCITLTGIALGIHYKKAAHITRDMWETMWSAEYAGIWRAMSVDMCLYWLVLRKQPKKNKSGAFITNALHKHITTQMSATNLLALYNKHRECLNINMLVMHAESAEFLGLCMDTGLPIVAGGWYDERNHTCRWPGDLWRTYSKYVSYEDAFAAYAQRPSLGATTDARASYEFERAYGFPAKNKKHAQFLLDECIAKHGIDTAFARLIV